jgi:hypothetical protein
VSVKIFKNVLLLILLFASYKSFAQQVSNLGYGSSTSAGVIGTTNTSVDGPQYSKFYLKASATGNPTSYSIQIEGSTDHGSTYSLCGSAAVTSLTPSQVSCTGQYDKVQLNITNITGGTSPVVYWSFGYANDTNVSEQTVAHVIVDSAPASTVLNPCLDNTQDPSSAVVNITDGSTLEIVPLTAGQRVYICPSSVTSGVAGTFKLVTGTGVNCGSGQSDLTGVFTTAVGTPIPIPQGIKVPAGQAVCGVATGVLSSVNGVVVYIKK